MRYLRDLAYLRIVCAIKSVIIMESPFGLSIFISAG
jgi:hypothetical protein